MTNFLDKFNDPEYGLLSTDKFYRKLKDDGYDVSRKQVNDFLNKQATVQINKQPPNTQTGLASPSRITARHINGCWQADLMDLSKYSKLNKGYNWIFTCIDVYSRKAWVVPLKKKTNLETVKAFKSIITVSKPENLTTDNGKEFLGKEFQKVLQDNGIKHWLPENDSEKIRILGIVERFNRTIRTFIRKLWTLNNNKNWIDSIYKIVNNYNSNFHNTIKSIPNDVYSGKQIFNNQFRISDNTQTQPDSRVHVGNFVRLKVKHKIFDKIERSFYQKS